MTTKSLDPLSAAFAADPYLQYAKLRASAAPVYFAPLDAWLVSRYQDVDRMARNPKMLRVMDDLLSTEELAAQQRAANWHDMPNHARFVQFSLLDSDGDIHRRLRLLVLRNFSKQFVQRHRGMIQQYVDSLLDKLIEQGTFDFVTDLAAHIPGHIIGNVLGVPDDECPQLRKWSEDIVQFFDVERTAENKKLAEEATTEFYAYLLDLIKLRRAAPKLDLLSSLIAAQDAGELNETELISTCMLILMAGHGSTIDVLGTGMLALLNFPDEMQKLKADPSAIHTAVEEMFRYESPLPFFHRYASTEVEFMGRLFPAGTKFGLLYGSANRDPQQFQHADQFDISRTPNRHMAFGRGAHLCLGNNLAKLDMEVILLSLLGRTRVIECLTENPTYHRGIITRGLSSLTVRLHA